MDYTYHTESPLGGITLASDGRALTGLWFDGQKHFAETLAPDHTDKLLPVFEETLRWLDQYFSGICPDFKPPLAPRGSAFRQAVWQALLTIPCGRTMTYGQIAEKITGPAGTARVSARAVGGAIGHNPISLIIPCHRVTGAGGNLTGYAGGIDKKECLLRLEQAFIDHSAG